jgi:hypothetical protein
MWAGTSESGSDELSFRQMEAQPFAAAPADGSFKAESACARRAIPVGVISLLRFRNL